MASTPRGRPASPRVQRRDALADALKAVHGEVEGRHGSPRIHSSQGDARARDRRQDGADFVRMTTEWSEEQWHRAQVRAIDRAYGHFVDSDVLRPILEDWIRLAAERASSASLRIPA